MMMMNRMNKMMNCFLIVRCYRTKNDNRLQPE